VAAGVVILALGVASGTAAASPNELVIARADAQQIVDAYAELAGGAPAQLCRLMSSSALRELGGLARCGQTLGDPRLLSTKIDLGDRSVTEAYVLRHLKIHSVRLTIRGGRQYAIVLLLPRRENGYWQWLLLKEGGRYRLFQDTG
jgi:hypothetical protein